MTGTWLSSPAHLTTFFFFFFLTRNNNKKIAECVEAPPFRARPLGRPSCFPCPFLLLPGGAGGVDCGPWGPRCCPPGCSPGRAQGGGEGGTRALGKAHPPASTHGQRPDSVQHSLLFLPGATGRIFSSNSGQSLGRFPLIWRGGNGRTGCMATLSLGAPPLVLPFLPVPAAS